MLSQQMTKAACLAMIDVQREREVAIANRAAVEFERILEALILGAVEEGLAAEADPVTLKQLHHIKRISPALTRSVQQIAAGDFHTVAVGMIMERNLPTLAEMNRAVVMIEAQADGLATPAELASTINLAGRQRMLTQKMMKEACFIHAGLDPQKNRTALADSIQLFGKTLAGLQNGDPANGLIVPPNAGISTALAKSAGIWGEVQPTLAALAGGGDIHPQNLGPLSVRLDALLASMNAAVGLYADSRD